MGYGARALQELNAFYSGELSNLDDLPESNEGEQITEVDMSSSEDALHSESLSIRAPSAMPPLLQRLSERRPPVLDYIGVSYGLTPQLLRFWKRSGYVPLYLRQTPNDLTGEHSCVMLKALGGVDKEEEGWLDAFATGAFHSLPFVESESGRVVALTACSCACGFYRLPKEVPCPLVVQVQGVYVGHVAQHHRGGLCGRQARRLSACVPFLLLLTVRSVRG